MTRVVGSEVWCLLDARAALDIDEGLVVEVCRSWDDAWRALGRHADLVIYRFEVGEHRELINPFGPLMEPPGRI